MTTNHEIVVLHPNKGNGDHCSIIYSLAHSSNLSLNMIPNMKIKGSILKIEIIASMNEFPESNVGEFTK